MSLAAEKTIGTANPVASAGEAGSLILVIEDDAALLKLIEKCLTAIGHRTWGVTGGEAALTWLETHSPNLMLLDYSLPDMRGEQILQCLEARGKRVPFVVATGHGNESVAVEMMKRGAHDYLVKGSALMKLLPAVVDRALERERQAERLIETEEELRQAHDELEQRVEQRTAELAEVNRRLLVEMEERRLAEERSQQHLAELAHVARLSTMGEMVAELAHELNQPLSAISSYAQACKRLLDSGEGNHGEELSSSLGQVVEQANRAGEIIRRVRRFVAKNTPSEEAIDVNAMIRDVAGVMAFDARSVKAEVVTALTEPLPPVVGDRIQIEQVLVNLMRNGFEALRESPREPRQVTVHTAFDGRRHIVIDVHDNGRGIPPDVLDRVFDRFFTTKPDGMGMGLAISRSIVENHGGTLWATPAAEGGAAFHFTLPIETGELDRGH